MESFIPFLDQVRAALWGAPMLLLLFGTGLYLTVVLRGVQFCYMGYALRLVVSRARHEAVGDISHFEALMTSLAGAIGTGSIVGVATALAVGGVGALFWMWVTALFGMATKYAESLLAVKFRHADARGEMIGGPMEYIDRGLGWRWLASLFALFGAVAAIGTGNLVQVNSIVEAVGAVIPLQEWVVGVILAATVGSVILCGVRAIGHVSGVLVPLMALFYLAGGCIIILYNYAAIPDALALIVTSAFTGQAAAGGFAGSTILVALQMGVSRSIFSNEAGMGISSIAAAAAKTDSPGRQAMITMTGALLSTGIVCTITGLVIAVTGVLGQLSPAGKMINGAPLAILAFSDTFSAGGYVVIVGLVLFALSTIVAWGYYGEKCCEYLLGERCVWYYRYLYTLIIIPGAVMNMELIWTVADISNALMVLPNLIALLMLSPVAAQETGAFIAQVEREKREASSINRTQEEQLQ